jgi:hypothetical protein
MIHERFCSNRALGAATSLGRNFRPARLALEFFEEEVPHGSDEGSPIEQTWD